VPQNRSVAWWRIAIINVLFSFSLPSLVAGMDLANGTPSSRLVTGILAGSAILTVIAILTSIVGARSRLSSYLLARLAFGTRGSMLLNLAFAVSLVGWFGVIITLMGQALALNRHDMLDLMLALDLGAGAFAIVIGSSWLLNAMNLYSASLSLGAAVPRLSGSVATIACGIIGTAAAFLKILDHFLSFLFYLSIVFVPVASVVIIDALLLRPRDYFDAADPAPRALEPAALLAWAAGATFAVLGSMGWIRLSGIAALDAMFISGLLYLLLRWRARLQPAAA
jgi:cytosine permease